MKIVIRGKRRDREWRQRKWDNTKIRYSVPEGRQSQR
jgi:hypothetical protein